MIRQASNAVGDADAVPDQASVAAYPICSHIALSSPSVPAVDDAVASTPRHTWPVGTSTQAAAEHHAALHHYSASLCRCKWGPFIQQCHGQRLPHNHTGSRHTHRLLRQVCHPVTAFMSHLRHPIHTSQHCDACSANIWLHVGRCQQQQMWSKQMQ